MYGMYVFTIERKKNMRKTSKYWIADTSDYEPIGIELDVPGTRQEARKYMWEHHNIRISSLTPVSKSDLYFSELDIY